MAAPLRSVLVVGTGLMGTSLALALKRRGLVGHVAGCEPHDDSRAQAKERAVFAAIESDLTRALAAKPLAELIVLAAPPRAVREMLAEVAQGAPAGSLVLDLASTKHAIVEAAG